MTSSVVDDVGFMLLHVQVTPRLVVQIRLVH